MNEKLIIPLLLTIFVSAAESVQAQCGPYTIGEVPAATSGFRNPLDKVDTNTGYAFTQAASYSCGLIRHPGKDMNTKSGDGDLGEPVYAVADGKVVYTAHGNDWGGVVIQHNYRGVSWYSQYGHVQNILVTCGQPVSQGQKIAEIGNIGAGANNAHLHFEIREADHPNPTLGPYFCDKCATAVCLSDLAKVHNWYENPIAFTLTHGAYGLSTPYVWGFNVGGYFEGWDAFNISGASVNNGILFIDPQGNDPHMDSEPLAANAGLFQYVQFVMASNAPDGNGNIYFKTSVENFYSSDKRIEFSVQNCPPSVCGGNAQFLYYNVRVGLHSKWQGAITGIRIDPANDGIAGTSADTIGFDYVRLSTSP